MTSANRVRSVWAIEAVRSDAEAASPAARPMTNSPEGPTTTQQSRQRRTR